MRAAWNWIVMIVSGEWLLRRQSNGGDLIIARTIIASSTLYICFIGIKHVLDPSRAFAFSAAALQQEAFQALPVLGGLLAAVYATLYTRFAAQWNYLAGLYNQIIKAEIDLAVAGREDKLPELACWKASFIEDAEDLHLSTKRIFLPTIRDWLADAHVRQAYLDGAVHGQSRLDELEKRLARAAGVQRAQVAAELSPARPED